MSFTAKEGEVTALVGSSGSGKSTCARMAAGLWDIFPEPRTAMNLSGGCSRDMIHTPIGKIGN